MQIIIEKVKEICKKHPIVMILIIVIIFLVCVPLMIQAMYHTPAPCELLEEKIPAGNLLAYIGSVLTFGATFMLSLSVYLSNKEQSKRARISENKAMLVIDNDKNIRMNVLKPLTKDEHDIFINLELKILSKAMISKIDVTHFSVSDYNHYGDSNWSFCTEYEKGKDVIFQYQSNDKIMITFDSKDEKLLDILNISKALTIGFDLSVTCENVKTILTMNVTCERYEINGDESCVERIYNIKNSNAAWLDTYIY